jgi:Rrf2 family protein
LTFERKAASSTGAKKISTELIDIQHRPMRLSKKSDYALRVLFDLVEHRGRGPVSMNDLAKRNDVPKRFLEHIMLELKKEGWVESFPGRKGGYQLAQDPEKITMGQVVRRFDGVLAPIGCVSVSHPVRCSQESTCRFRRSARDSQPHGWHHGSSNPRACPCPTAGDQQGGIHT